MKTNTDEKEEIKEVLKEAASITTFEDVDKFHRMGPRKEKKQDAVVRFKSHSARKILYQQKKHKT